MARPAGAAAAGGCRRLGVKWVSSEERAIWWAVLGSSWASGRPVPAFLKKEVGLVYGAGAFGTASR